ncbi:MAG: class I SAM-dependent methyltransferase [Acidobacteriia bacterium]|nr:class I SAM-dependent methyltransferase [Terriglobia bacterium]
MRQSGIKLEDVQGVYSGPEGRLWELVMGEQIHAGGFASSTELAQKAGIKAGMRGVDLCCALGAGCRFLARNFEAVMCGVDATPYMIEEARKRAPFAEWGIEFKLGDVQAVPYPDAAFDFVWGEDAWCYVADKDRLVGEADRLLKKGGVVAFTDWVEGPAGLTEAEALRFNSFMKFPAMESIPGYRTLLEKHGFAVKESVEIPFAKYVDLYLAMLTEQLTFDALRILGGDIAVFQGLGVEMSDMQANVHAGKIARGRFIGVRK